MIRRILAPLLFAISFCSMNHIHSQERCGTKTPAIPYRVDSAMMAQQRSLYTSPLLVKVFLHIVANNNGGNRAVADTTMFRQMENMRQFYAPHNICFILAGIEQINNSDLNSQDSDAEAAEVISRAIAGVINVFVHDTLFNDDGSLNGLCYDITGNCLSVARYAMEEIDNRSTLAHEVGHCFGLYHTFDRRYGEENIDRDSQCANCLLTGDLLCDTEADPHSDTDDSANHIAGCEFNDPSNVQYCDGQVRHYRMDPHNIMAYGVRSCRSLLTNDQGARARVCITSASALMPCIAPDDMDITSIESFTFGDIIYTARTAVQVNSVSFTVSNSARANFSSNTQVIFKPGMEINPSGNGYTNARVSVLCQ
jgi:hypothetical protein